MTLRANFDYAATSIAHFTIIGCSACSRCLRQVSIADLIHAPKAHVLLSAALHWACIVQARDICSWRAELVVVRLSVRSGSIASVGLSWHVGGLHPRASNCAWTSLLIRLAVNDQTSATIQPTAATIKARPKISTPSEDAKARTPNRTRLNAKIAALFLWKRASATNVGAKPAIANIVK